LGHFLRREADKFRDCPYFRMQNRAQPASKQDKHVPRIGTAIDAPCDRLCPDEQHLELHRNTTGRKET
jgi:hypothetical protein